MIQIQKPLRVAYILKMYPRFSETFIVNEILAHEANGLDVEIISLRSPVDGRFHEDHARVRAPVTYVKSGIPKAERFWQELQKMGQIYPQLWSFLRNCPDLALDDAYQTLLVTQLVVKHKITLMHAHFGSVATTVARLVSRITGIPFLFTAHAKDIFHESVDPADLRHKLQDAARVITVSDYNVEHLQDMYGSAANTVRRIYNGLDLNKFQYDAPIERPRRIVGVGRLIEKKGFGSLIDACGILARRGCDFECEIIGAGAFETDLRSQIAHLGLEEQVKMLGPRPQGEVARRVQHAAVFAAPCVVGSDGNRDGLPTVLLEAMALGTPCVSTDVTGIPEVLQDGITGLMTPQRDPIALADALQRLLDVPALRVQLTTCARQLIEENFDIQRNAAQIRALYRDSTEYHSEGTQVEVA